jgi:hypothetical protein
LKFFGTPVKLVGSGRRANYVEAIRGGKKNSLTILIQEGTAKKAACGCAWSKYLNLSLTPPGNVELGIMLDYTGFRFGLNEIR